MRTIAVTTEVFAKIWSLHQKGDGDENAILERVLFAKNECSSPRGNTSKSLSQGIFDKRYNVLFTEGFAIERCYLGREYRAVVCNGQWELEGSTERFSSLNQLSRAVGTRTENAWQNWYFIDSLGNRCAVSELRDPSGVRKREAKRSKGELDSSHRAEVAGTRWCDDVRSALVALGGRAPLSKIYRKVREIRGAAGRSTPKSLEEVVRKELEMRSSDSQVFDAERGEDWFCLPEGKGTGIWALR